jgi:phosphoribosylamine---glycine ligase
MSSLLMPTRILVVGGGGREHALAWKLAAEPGVNEVFVAPGSAAIGREPRVTCLPEVDPLDPAAVVEAARSTSAELVVVGPEAPLAAGVADACTAAGIAVFGPSRAAAELETSKSFCHDVAAAAGVRMARAGSFRDLAGARAFAAELAAPGDGLVVKADGLAAGKGVMVCDSLAEAEAALDVIFGDGPDLGAADDPTPGRPRVVLEERLRGHEASVIALCDGRAALALPAARDHKRLGDGETGPNTGGMGAYSPLPDLPDEAVEAIIAEVHRPLLAEMARRRRPFRGALYAGLILTADGPVLLECNARFGDPETQVILPRLAGPLGPLLRAAARGELAAAATLLGLAERGTSRLPVLPGAAVGIVLASAGYPEGSRRGDTILGLDHLPGAGDSLVFHSGTRLGPNGAFQTNGGRVLTAVGRGADLASARAAAELLAARIAFDGSQRRHDIAADPPAGALGDRSPVTVGGAA